MNEDNAPVLVVTNKKGRLIHAGDPKTFNKKTLSEYAKEGYQIKTITIKQFRSKQWKWPWETEV